MVKKFWIAILACALMSVSFVGCAPRVNNVNPGTDYEVNLDIDYQVSAELRVGLNSVVGAETDYIEALAAEFNKLYRNVKITVQPMISGSYDNALQNAHQTGNMPDIFFTTSSMFPGQVEKGLTLNLSPYISAETEKNSEWEKQFVESGWKLGQKDMDGDQMMVPRSTDRIVTHYNKKIFMDAGVDMSTVKNGWTWEDFLAACAKIRTYFNKTNRQDQYFLQASLGWEALFSPMLASYGGKVFNEDKSIAFDSPEVREMLEDMKYLVDERYMAPLNQAGADFFTGTGGAMFFHSSPANLIKANVGEDYDIVTFPLIGDDPHIGAGAAGYSIYAGSKNRDIAWKFLSFMISKKGQNALARAGLTLAPLRVDMQDPNLNDWGKGNENINMAAYTWRPELNYATSWQLPFPSGMHQDLLDTMENMVFNYLRDPDGLTLDGTISHAKTEVQAIISR